MLDMILNGVYRVKLEVESIINKMMEGRLRWFRHIRRRQRSTPVRRVEALVVDRSRRKGRPKPRWEDKLKLDMKELLLSEGMTFDRNEWRARTSLSLSMRSSIILFISTMNLWFSAVLTYEAIDLPPDCKTVGSKWIFKKKTDMDGNVHIYKARLVAKGYTQTYMVDYEETFSPVADIRAIRILISIAAFYDYEIWQIVTPRKKNIRFSLR
ncbi:putative retrotransposon ty1-copia subclass protein [Tanacetum coccineum]